MAPAPFRTGPFGTRHGRDPRDWSTGQGAQARCKEIAADLGTTEDAVKQALHRLRRQFGVLLREVIGATVSNRDEVDDELKHLLRAISP